ncbi:hypothetical protein GGF32_008065, partial [Allomyces javanicus]
PKPAWVESMPWDEFKQFSRARYGYITADPRIGTKPVMDEEQRIRMVETTLVAIFDYMVDIIEQHPYGSALVYAARSIEDPHFEMWHDGYLGSVVHDIACKCLLDFRWSGPMDGFDSPRKFVKSSAPTLLTDRTEGAFTFMLNGVYRMTCFLTWDRRRP